jgi:hypothetical protein
MDYRSNLFNRWRTGSNLRTLDHCSYLIFAYRGACGFQPEGLSDISRWSQRSADHRKEVPTWSASGRGATVFLTAVPGVELFRLLSGGLRYAATTGYYLTAFQGGAHRTLAPVLPLRTGLLTFCAKLIGVPLQESWRSTKTETKN